MRSHYKRLGPYIRQVDIRNSAGKEENLLGVSTQKVFIESIANTVGTDFTKYKVVKKNQFTYVPDTSRRGDRIGIALLESHAEGLVSNVYTVFEVTAPNELDPQYLMMWFRRPEFDRYARYMSHGSVREIFGWEEMCEVELPLPPIAKQREIVREYNTIVSRIKLSEQFNYKLEETVMSIFSELFPDADESDNSHNQKLETYIEFNPKHSIKNGFITSYVEMADLQEDKLSIRSVIKRPFTSGSKFMNMDTLLARITPCLENGKTAFVDCLEDDEIAYGSTEFIVMRAKPGISPYWVYCLARNDRFRSYAISSMVGSSGRQRVHSDYLKEYILPNFNRDLIDRFHELAEPIFNHIKQKSIENQKLIQFKELLLIGVEKSYFRVT
jgi:type I restriction enzyme S subunit